MSFTPSRGSRRRLLGAAAYSFMLVCIAGAAAVTAMNNLRKERLEARLNDRIEQAAIRLETDLERSLSIAYPLRALVQERQGDFEWFDAVAEEMMRIHPTVLSIQLAPGGTIEYIVPFEANAPVLGLNVFDDPGKNRAAYIARESGELTLAGPFEMKQGGVGAIGRLPIFMTDEQTGQPDGFWGFATVVLSFPELVSRSGLDELTGEDIEFTLFRTNPDSGEKESLAGESSLPRRVRGLNRTIRVPNGDWTLRLVPANGWYDTKELTFEWLMVFISALLAAISAYFGLRAYSAYHLLDESVKERTLELEASRRKLVERNEELEIARKKAEANDASKSRFLAHVSHEIRTPLSGMMGFTDLMSREGNLTELQRKRLNVMRDSGGRLLDVLDGLLDIAQIESGAVKVSKRPVDVNGVLQEVYELFQPEAERRGLELQITHRLPSGESLMFSDEEKLRGILVNLVKNALKYTLRGWVYVGVSRDQEILTLGVSDSGPGIDQTEFARIFERFERGEGAERRVSGSGLGLSIVKGYVDALHGKLSLDSQKGRGSSFVIQLPYQQAEPSHGRPLIARREVDESEVPHHTHLLVVEDDVVNQQILKAYLTPVADTVSVVSNGLDAVELVRSDASISCVFMDMQMPVMNGYEASKRIQKMRPELPIIGQTASVGLREQQLALDAGCCELMRKPYSAAELYTTLSRVSHSPTRQG